MSGIMYDKNNLFHASNMPGAIQLVKKDRPVTGHTGWRLNTHGFELHLEHWGIYDENGIITTRTVNFPANQVYADSDIVGPYTPAANQDIVLKKDHSQITVTLTGILDIKKMTVKNMGGYTPPQMLSVEVCDNSTYAEDGDWYPILHLTNPFDGNDFITIPIPTAFSDAFEFGGVAKSDGTVEACITNDVASVKTPLPVSNKGVVEFADYDELLSWHMCFTRPTLFKTLDNGKFWMWRPCEDSTHQNIRELV